MEASFINNSVLAQILIVTGASIVGILGWAHLLLTFFSHKFNARNSDTTAAMKETSPLISQQTTMWRAWIGFNASHSLGALMFAAVYLPLAIYHISVIESSLWFTLLPCLVSISYLILAKQYWFNVPMIGMLISSGCFISASLIIHL